jgi:hypothetical protein
VTSITTFATASTAEQRDTGFTPLCGEETKRTGEEKVMKAQAVLLDIDIHSGNIALIGVRHQPTNPKVFISPILLNLPPTWDRRLQ